MKKKNVTRSSFKVCSKQMVCSPGLVRKMADGTVITFSNKGNAVKKTFSKKFVMPLDFDFFQSSSISLSTQGRFHYKA